MLSIALMGLLAAAPSIALPGVSQVGLEKGEVELYANLLATGLRQRGLTVIATEDVVAVLGMERQRQLLGCGTECSAEIAAALGTDGVLVARIGLLGRGYTLSVRVVSAKDASVLADTSETASSGDAMPLALNRVAWSLASQLEKKWPDRGMRAGLEPLAPVEKVSRRSWAWLPFGVAVASLGVGIALRVKAETTYAQLQVASSGTALSLKNTGNLEQGLGFGLIGLGSAAAIAAALIAFLPSSDSAVSVGFAPTADGAFAVLRWSCP